MLSPELKHNRTQPLTAEQFLAADAALRAVEQSSERTGVVPLPGASLMVDMGDEGARLITQLYHEPNRSTGDAYRSFGGQYAEGDRAGSPVKVELRERNLAARALSLILRRSQPYEARFYDEGDTSERFRVFPDL